MLQTVKDILDACPTHGAGTLTAHANLCPNEEHRQLAEALLKADGGRAVICGTDRWCKEQIKI